MPTKIFETEINPIGALVIKQEQNYTSGTPNTISKYVEFDLFENNNKIDAYINSKHISGLTDRKGREKPFFNIVRAARNIWYRATDLDRKNFRIKAQTSKDMIASFLATAKLHEYMNRENFGSFLNEWGLALATYGSSVVKFVQKGDRLHTMVVPWNTLIIDPIDFDKAPVIEVLEMTEAELFMNPAYDKEQVEALCAAKRSRETLDKRQKDTRSDFIKLYEVHGEMPLSYLTGKEKDEDTYVQQMHVISMVAGKMKGAYDTFTLASGKEEKHPYMITHLIKEDGRATGYGAVESLFENQWMVNHTAKQIKDQLDLASKLIFQTADGNFVGQNALTAIETGDILIHSVNSPLKQVANNSHDITSLQNFQTQWKALGNEITGISESMLGNNPPSGTAWRQTEALLQESHSLFELMTENKGLALEEMGRKYIIPFIKTQLNTTEEVATTLNAYGIEKISEMYIKNEGAKRYNDKVKQALLKGDTPDGISLEGERADVRSALADLGNNRFISPDSVGDSTWKDVFKNFEWDCEFEITGENKDKQAALTTLNTTLQLILSKQGQPFSPEEKLILNKILTLTGEVSTAELDTLHEEKQTETPMQQQPMPTPEMTPPTTA